MQYSDFLDQVLDSDVLLFRGSPLYSRVIQRWTKSEYSHVALAVRTRAACREYVDCLEFMEGVGGRSYPIEVYLRQGVKIDWFRLTDPTVDRCKSVSWFMERRGHQYASPRQLFRSFVTVPLLESMGLPTKIDSNRYFCSYAVALALEHGGLRLPLDDALRPELASPGDISLLPCLHRMGPITLEAHRETI